MKMLREVFGRADVAFGHTFRPPPYGGSNQFLLALRRELERRGLRTSEQVITRKTRAMLLNAHVFDVDYLRRHRRPDLRVVHRVDGPLAAYRGFDDGTDELIGAINAELADATIFQSRYSLDANLARGLEFRDPVVIPNAVDPAIFWAPPVREVTEGRPIRVVAASWSDNPNKGGATYAWLDEHVDPDRFSLTFVGNSQVSFARTRHIPPLPSEQLADVLRDHDLFLIASWHEPCSNALLEALACGLPVVYRDSGGNRELAGAAGVAFEHDEEVPVRLEEAARRYAELRDAIASPTIAEIAGRYLQTMRIDP
jgi:glycosyltransferase involved in cell wall biosynthesis